MAFCVGGTMCFRYLSCGAVYDAGSVNLSREISRCGSCHSSRSSSAACLPRVPRSSTAASPQRFRRLVRGCRRRQSHHSASRYRHHARSRHQRNRHLSFLHTSSRRFLLTRTPRGWVWRVGLDAFFTVRKDADVPGVARAAQVEGRGARDVAARVAGCGQGREDPGLKWRDRHVTACFGRPARSVRRGGGRRGRLRCGGRGR